MRKRWKKRWKMSKKSVNCIQAIRFHLFAEESLFGYKKSGDHERFKQNNLQIKLSNSVLNCWMFIVFLQQQKSVFEKK